MSIEATKGMDEMMKKNQSRASSIEDEMILDIQRVAHSLNTYQLSLDDYLKNGGKFSAADIDEADDGGFANKCELAGIKYKRTGEFI